MATKHIAFHLPQNGHKTYRKFSHNTTIGISRYVIIKVIKMQKILQYK